MCRSTTDGAARLFPENSGQVRSNPQFAKQLPLSLAMSLVVSTSSPLEFRGKIGLSVPPGCAIRSRVVLIAAPPERSFAVNLARDTAILDDLH